MSTTENTDRPKVPFERKGTAYFPTFEGARDFGEDVGVGKGHPAWRVVYYDLGWAIQARPGGPYLNLKGEWND